MKRTKRWLCLLLVFCMMLSVLPVTASAENAAESTAEHHLLLADDFTPNGWMKETADTAHAPLSTYTLKGHTQQSTTGGPATATVKIETAGEYHVWVHALYHQAAEIQSTSWKTKVKVNKMVLDTVFGGHHNAADAYVWVDGGAVTLATGNTTIALDDSEYKDWARVDGVWLSSSNYNPTGKPLRSFRLRQSLEAPALKNSRKRRPSMKQML